MNLPDETYSFIVEGEFYSPGIISGITGLEKLRPIVEINLEPGYRYPFPQKTTILKGTVFDISGIPVSYAKVSSQNGNRNTFTDRGGNFLFYYQDQVTDPNMKLQISKKGFSNKSTTCKLVKESVIKTTVTLRKK